MINRRSGVGFLSPFNITMIYLVVAALWITFTDQILEALVPDMKTLSQFQTYKGFFYIITTSLGLYLLITKYASHLNQTIHEKDTLLKEVHHRVKNNLAVISGFIQMQRMASESDRVEETLSKSETRIKSIALIHEKMYQKESLSEIDFQDFLMDLISSIRTTVRDGEGVEIEVFSAPIILNVNQAVPCAIIVNELITNSLMHAFGNNSDVKGKKKIIEVYLKEQNDKVSIEVADNGEGIPEGFDLAGQSSMGFSIINTLIQQLEADYSMDGGDGATFRFSFKKELSKGDAASPGLLNA